MRVFKKSMILKAIKLRWEFWENLKSRCETHASECITKKKKKRKIKSLLESFKVLL